MGKLKLLFFLGLAGMLFSCNAEIPLPTPAVPVEPTEEPAPEPTDEPRPTATALPTLLPKPTQRPPAAPLPTATPAAGYYKNPELGFAFHYPAAWQTEETGGSLPAVIISDNDDPILLYAGSELLEANTELVDFAEELTLNFAVSETLTVLDQQPFTLADGSEAVTLSFAWTETNADDEEEDWQAEALATLADGKGIALVMRARPEIISTRSRTFQAIAETLTLDQPELFGISRANALVLLTDPPAVLDPAKTNEQAGGIIGHLFSGLVKLSPALQPVGDLAESWETSDGGKVYTFALRDSLTFHSGEPLTAESVQKSWARAAEVGSPLAKAIHADIEVVEVVDELTLKVTLKEAYPWFLFRLTQPAMMVVSPADVDNTGEWRRPDGSGPFTLRRWENEEVILLDRFEEHHAPANIENIIYLPYGEFGLNSYDAGFADMAKVFPFNLSRVLDPSDPLSASLIRTDTLCSTHVLFDTSRPPFDNATIRQAFAGAVDTDTLATVVLNGAADGAHSFIPPQMPGHVPASSDAEEDEAVADLALGDEPIIFFVAGEGEPDALVTALIDQWNTELGVDSIEVQQVLPAAYDLAQHSGAGNGHIYLREWCAPSPDPIDLLDLLFHSDGPLNVGGYHNETVDNLLEQARVAPDPAARITFYQQAEALILADAPAVPLLFGKDNLLKRSWIDGFEPSPISRLWQNEVTISRDDSE